MSLTQTPAEVEDRRFAIWMREVDNVCYARVGLAVHDLPDIDFRGLFDGGTSARSAASKAIRNGGGE